MSLKKLFGKEEYSPSLTLQEAGNQAESAGLVEATVEQRERFVPPVNYSKPEEFVRYGLAEQYYDEAFSHILANYPYDGSLKEKVEFHNKATNLDNWIFENEYPRTTGYATFSPSGWGTVVTRSFNYGNPTTKEHILFKGGPLSGNVYNPAKTRDSNLRFGGSEGNTVEFWLNKFSTGSLATHATKSPREVVFDCWTTGSISSSAGYGRFRVELGSSSFLLTYASGTSGIFNYDSGISPTLNTWQHFAFSFASSSAGTTVTSYVNGVRQSVVTTGTAITPVSGALHATIGSLVGRPSGSTIPSLGWGKLSGSIDEFRFWKKKRNEEKVGKFWLTQVGAGVNSDDANTDLGVYFKFNEGITTTASLDSVVLDFSGRISNGTWTGYATGARNTGSAMVSASAITKEFHDPIMRGDHPTYRSTKLTFMQTGSIFDDLNAGSMYNSFPEWILDRDGKRESYLLRTLTQVVSSYFDELHLQMEWMPKMHDAGHLSGTVKPHIFMDRILASEGMELPELFQDASVFENILDRNDERLFDESLETVKNKIYKNIHSNLTQIYKAKGTNKSIRNMLHCFGIDDDLVRLNLYADNQTYDFRDNYRFEAKKKKYADFNDTTRFGGTVFQYPETGNSDSIGYISGSSNSNEFTVECEVFFPQKFDITSEFFFHTPFLTSSLFGMHTATTGSETTWAVNDSDTFNVFAVRPESNSKHCKFVLSSSAPLGGIPTLSSSLFYDVYDNTRWIFAVKVRPENGERQGYVSGSTSDYTVEFHGMNIDSGVVREQFAVSGTIGGNPPDYANALALYDARVLSGLASGSSVTTWNDIGPNGNHLTASATPPLYAPSISPGSGPGLQFTDSTANSMGISQPLLPATSEFTVYTVVRAETDAAVWEQYSGAGDPGRTVLSQNSSIDWIFFAAGVTRNRPFIASTGYELWTNTRTSAGRFKMYRSQTEVDDDPDGGISISQDHFQIGGESLSPVDGYISAIYVYTGSHDATTRTQVWGYLENAFFGSASVAGATSYDFSGLKRLYAGAHRTNFSGSLLHSSDVKIGGLRYWHKCLTNEEIKKHAFDSLNYGTEHPEQNAYAYRKSIDVPEYETLALDWGFNTLSSSNASGEFTVPDLSSGSSAQTSRYDIGNILKYQHTGKGTNFAASATASFDALFIPNARQKLPEVQNSSDMIEIFENDEKTLKRNRRPINHFFAIEKSMHQTVSEQMVNMFAGMTAFNDLIGQPVNQYRSSYKQLNRLKHLFYERVREEIDFEQFLDFYKWIDSSISTAILNLVPASANINESVRNLYESHILERSKYRRKLSTLTFAEPTLTASFKGSSQLNWRLGSRPIDGLENNNSIYWNIFAERDDAPLSGSNSGSNWSRVQLQKVIQSGYERQELGPVVLRDNKIKRAYHKGNNSTQGVGTENAFNILKFGSGKYLEIGKTDIEELLDTTDDDLLSSKKKKGFGLTQKND